MTTPPNDMNVEDLMSEVIRRDVLFVPIGLTAALTVPSAAALSQSIPGGDSGVIAPRPLPFDPKTVPGLSEKILTSHHQNNYSGAVRRIGAIGAQLASLDPGSAPGFPINGLKREQLFAINSMWLHELYFSSLGSAASRPGQPLANQIERDFGSDAAWRREFSAMGKARGGGSGWVVLMWSPRLRRLVNQWAADHSMTLADGVGLIALDMYEHAYHMDYGANAGAYVDAFMNVLNWRVADRSFATATRVH